MINLAGHLIPKCGCWRRRRRYGGRPWHDGDTRNPSMPPAERSIGQRSTVEHREISGASREWLLTDLPWIKRGERREGYSGASLSGHSLSNTGTSSLLSPRTALACIVVYCAIVQWFDICCVVLCNSNSYQLSCPGSRALPNLKCGGLNPTQGNSSSFL